jgi:hypothetical protein
MVDVIVTMTHCNVFFILFKLGRSEYKRYAVRGRGVATDGRRVERNRVANWRWPRSYH